MLRWRGPHIPPEQCSIAADSTQPFFLFLTVFFRLLYEVEQSVEADHRTRDRDKKAGSLTDDRADDDRSATDYHQRDILSRAHVSVSSARSRCLRHGRCTNADGVGGDRWTHASLRICRLCAG